MFYLCYYSSDFIKSGHWLLFPAISWIDNRSELVASFDAILQAGFEVHYIPKENCSRWN